MLETDSENQKVINEISKSLKIGGKFVIDVANRDKIIRSYLWRDHRYHDDGTIVIIDRKFDHIFGGHYETLKLFFKKRRKKEFKINLRFYSVTELIAMFNKAGLEFAESYGDFDFTPISFSSPNYILIG